MAEEKKNLPEEDDGRTVAPMNVDGMPWYVPKDRKSISSGSSGPQESLSPKEKRAMLTGVMGAALLISAVFGAVFLLFILFCVYVWFR